MGIGTGWKVEGLADRSLPTTDNGLRMAIQRAIYAAAVIEREDGHVLIAAEKDQPDSSRLWHFPRCPVASGETPEAAIRRFAAEDIGMPVEVIEGRPPLVAEVDGCEIELRYLFCGPVGDDPCQDYYAEVRWVPKAHLREYDFDAASKPVAEWMLGNDSD